MLRSRFSLQHPTFPFMPQQRLPCRHGSSNLSAIFSTMLSQRDPVHLLRPA